MDKVKKRVCPFCGGPRLLTCHKCVVLRRLTMGEQIRIGDWCCDPRIEPQRVNFEQKRHPVFISDNHHPHYRIIFLVQNRRKS